MQPFKNSLKTNIVNVTRTSNILSTVNENVESSCQSQQMHQFEFDSSKVGHLKTLRHTGEKLNKCNKCYYISAQVSNSRTHIKTQSGESFDKWDDCGNIAYSWTVHLRIHVENNTLWGKVK